MKNYLLVNLLNLLSFLFFMVEESLLEVMKDTASYFGRSGVIDYVEDIGKKFNGKRNETHLIEIGMVRRFPFVWKRFVEDFSKEQVLFQIEISDALKKEGILTPVFYGRNDWKRIYERDGRNIVLQQYLPSEQIQDASLEQCVSAVEMHGRFMKALEGKEFEYAQYAPSRKGIVAAREELTRLLDAELIEGTGTSREEEKRIKGDEIPRLLNLSNELKQYDSEEGVSMIHGDFQWKNIGYVGGKAEIIYDFDQVRLDLPSADLAHTIDMFTIKRQEKDYDPNAPTGAFRFSPYEVNYEKAEALVNILRDKGIFSDEEIAKMPESLAIWTLNGLAMHYHYGMEVPTMGHKKLSREFMLQTRLNACLNNEKFRGIFKDA